MVVQQIQDGGLISQSPVAGALGLSPQGSCFVSPLQIALLGIALTVNIARYAALEICEKVKKKKTNDSLGKKRGL